MRAAASDALALLGSGTTSLRIIQHVHLFLRRAVLTAAQRDIRRRQIVNRSLLVPVFITLSVGFVALIGFPSKGTWTVSRSPVAHQILQSEDKDLRRHDFGVVLSGTEASHEFRIPNMSGDTWRIESVKTKCGCTAADPDEYVVPPGDILRILARLKTAGRRSPTRQPILVRFENEIPPIELELMADIKPPIGIEPRNRRHVVESQESLKTVFRIVNNGATPWSHVSATYSSGARTAAAESMVTGQLSVIPAVTTGNSLLEEWEVHVTIPPSLLRTKSTVFMLHVVATDVNGQELKEECRFDVARTSDITLTPQTIFLDLSQPAPILKRTVIRYGDLNQIPGNITVSLEGDLPVDVSCAPGNTDRGIQIVDVAFTPNDMESAKTARGELTFHFGSPPSRNISVPVRVIRRGGAK